MCSFGSFNLSRIPLVQPHVLCNECFQMEDLLAAHFASMLVEGSPLDDFRFQRIVRLGYQLPRERLNDRCRIDTM